jgi:hypothetical protein
MLNIDQLEIMDQGLAKLRDYMDKCGADEGWLVIFDKTPGKSWDQKIY